MFPDFDLKLEMFLRLFEDQIEISSTKNIDFDSFHLFSCFYETNVNTSFPFARQFSRLEQMETKIYIFKLWFSQSKHFHSNINFKHQK